MACYTCHDKLLMIPLFLTALPFDQAEVWTCPCHCKIDLCCLLVFQPTCMLVDLRSLTTWGSFTKDFLDEWPLKLPLEYFVVQRF